MSPMHHNLYYKSNILKKINVFSILKCECKFVNQAACE